ncbi:MAG: hypothetical protein JWN57_1911 [Frankiales bacterium]|nr:hypothetical protein [Frankiales bacterium]
MRRPTLLALVLAAASFLLRRRRAAARADRELWTEATSAPDLR